MEIELNQLNIKGGIKMGLFSKRLKDEQRGTALTLVNHLQAMLAYQQLSMEQYNDTIAALKGSSPSGSEIYSRPQFMLTESDMMSIIGVGEQN